MTLSSLVEAHPEVLGVWARRIFGDQMPIFAKFIHASFPARVHVGFRRAVTQEELIGWLSLEQTCMRELLSALRVSDAASFQAYQARYAAWATEQSLAAWRKTDDSAHLSAFGRFFEGGFDVEAWMRRTRANRAAIADALLEVDLRRESGNLLLTSAGIVHAIFGLSLQTHPRDRTRAPLEGLFAELAKLRAAGRDDAELARAIDSAHLPELRAANGAPPKNEAWMPMTLDGSDVLLEPQQTSDTTYSLADFYTPLVWGPAGARFRKGSATTGLSDDGLTGYARDLELGATALGTIRRSPEPAESVWGGSHEKDGAALLRIVDEPAAWPFFTAYQLEISGSVTLRPPSGVFQQLVVMRGGVSLADGRGAIGELGPFSPGFVPATLDGTYMLTAREPSTLLVLSVPGARGGAPEVAASRRG
jgi:hypothetical protein